MKPTTDSAARTEPPSEIDLRAIGAALKRHRRAILIPTLLAFILISAFVNLVTPRYTAETEVLLENQETFFTRPDRLNVQPDQVGVLDPEAVASQVQLINSRDIARRAIKQLQLAGNSEFDPLASGLNPLSRVFVMLHLIADPTRESAEARMVNKFLERLTVYSPPKTRVIVIQFTSRDAALATRTANTIAQLYLREQSAAKQATAKQSAEALATQIADLRVKLAAADAEREQYRLQSGLLAGSNNMTISGQQLADINSDLSKARSTQADAQAKASLIRELLRAGNTADVTDVVNNDTVRRIADNRVLAQTQLARESRTLLPEHPRIKELVAQLKEYDIALKGAAKQAAMTLENDAKIAGQRVANLENVLTQQKKVAGVANTDEVHLRALERVTQSYKDQLEASSAKYQEAMARQSSTATPADARIISTASLPQEPSFPKKIPYIVFGTVATFVFAVGFVVAGELLSGRAAVEAGAVPAMATPAAAGAAFYRQPRGVAGSLVQARTSKASPDPVFAAVGPKPTDAKLDDLRRSKSRGSAMSAGLATTVLAYLKNFGRSAATSSMETEEKVEIRPMSLRHGGTQTPETTGAEDVVASVDIPALVDRIVTAHVPGRGLQIVATDLGQETGMAILIDVGRSLSRKGRAIIVDLNPTPARLSVLASTSDIDIEAMHGLAELLAGDSSFAEVIHKDDVSRLHFIPSGLQEADFHDFDLILDALSETYDFIILVTPAFPESEIAKVMAPYADFILLASHEAPSGRSIGDLEDELTEAGAREVLLAGAVAQPAQKVA